MSDAPGRLTAALSRSYRIERELGQGGMATVYLAHDIKHDRKVAVKVLRPELAATLGSERFLSEIGTTAKLNHPHILALHDSGDAGGFLYYVMPLVEGESLRARMTREKTLPVEEAIRLTREVADALSYAHARDVIHRDIKPENILLQSGHAIVADFGIARAVGAAGAERMTQTGMAVGTPAYMSPEQSAGERDLDGRSDLYALASVLYEMLAGEPPFTGATMDAILVQRFTRPAPRVSLKRSNVPRAIDAALCTAMARAPEDRFATVERFAAALETRAPAAETELDRSIAVLPFANMSGDAENEYFSDGISEEIINALAQLPGLRVAARTSAFSFKGKNADLRSIGDQLSVATVLEGSVRKAGSRIRITAQLINVADGYHLWSERYDRELTDVFAIQDEIATAIARRLEVTLGPRVDRPLVKPPTANLQAYELYLKGHALVLQRGPGLSLAVACLEEAIALDPDFALALAELTKALLLSAVYGLIRPRDMRTRSEQAAARALTCDPELVATQIAAAMFALLVGYDREKSSRAWNRAIELDPTHAEARSLRALYDLCYLHGAYEESLRECRKAVELDPLGVHAISQFALVLGWSGAEDAVAEARRGIALDPNAFYPHWALLHALALGPSPAEGVVAGKAMLTKFGRHPWLLMGLSLASSAAHDRETAEAVHAELEARARLEYIQPTIRAVAALGAGRRPEVFRLLRLAVEDGDPMFPFVALHWPGFAAVRRDPEYAAVLSLIGWDVPNG